jgi:hypothetical protein
LGRHALTWDHGGVYLAQQGVSMTSSASVSAALKRRRDRRAAAAAVPPPMQEEIALSGGDWLAPEVSAAELRVTGPAGGPGPGDDDDDDDDAGGGGSGGNIDPDDDEGYGDDEDDEDDDEEPLQCGPSADPRGAEPTFAASQQSVL